MADAWEIVTETEPEWDDEQRGRLLSLARFEQGVCDCGFHESLTSDLANHFTPVVKVCNVCKGLAPFLRKQDAEDERAVKALGETPDPLAPRPQDGRRMYTRMMSADEVEQRKVSRSRGQADRR